MLAFLCGGCHSLKNLNIQINDSDYESVSNKATQELMEILANNGNQRTIDAIKDDLNRWTI